MDQIHVQLAAKYAKSEIQLVAVGEFALSVNY